jgi:hypothetical protein
MNNSVFFSYFGRPILFLSNLVFEVISAWFYMSKIVFSLHASHMQNVKEYFDVKLNIKISK